MAGQPDDPAQQQAACWALWGAALRQYWIDCHSDTARKLDEFEAFDDLHGSQRILKRLADRLGLDADYLARKFLAGPPPGAKPRKTTRAATKTPPGRA